MRLFVNVLFFLIILGQTSSDIAIDIEPEELQRMGEMLIRHYSTRNILHNGGIPTSNYRKVLLNVAQLIGITCSLVGANLITNALQPYPAINPQINEMIPSIANDTIKPSEICKYDFGCDENLCWRTCDDGMSNGQSWCYTAPKAEKRKIQSCGYSFECSPCWDCVGACFSKMSKT